MPGIIPDVSLGENSKFFIGSAELAVVRGVIRENPVEIDTGCNLTGGYTTRTRGRYNLEVSIEAQWIGTNQPFTNPPTVNPGNDIEGVLIYPDYENDPGGFYNMPIAYPANAVCNIDGVGVISYSLELRNQGEYGTPAGPLG